MRLRNSRLQQEATEVGLEVDFSRFGGSGPADELDVGLALASGLEKQSLPSCATVHLGPVCASEGKNASGRDENAHMKVARDARPAGGFDRGRVRAPEDGMTFVAVSMADVH